MKWIDIWGNAPSITEAKAEQYAKNITLTYLIPASVDGTAVKLRFSNRYGIEPITIDRLVITAIAAGDSEVFRKRQMVDYPLRPYAGADQADMAYDQAEAVDFPLRIEAGAEAVTEPISLPVERGGMLMVSFYLKDFTSTRSSVFTSGIYSGGYVTEGDVCGSLILPGFSTISTNQNYMLTDLWVRSDTQAASILCYGDSITAQDWPEYTMEAFNQENVQQAVVVRKAASGTRLTGQYDCMQYRSYGIEARKRYPHEFVTEGADAIMIQHGINDIIHPVGVDVNPFRPWSDLPTAEEMTAVYEEYIAFARKQGLKVLMGTLLPIENWRTYTEERDVLRNQVNDWIRTRGKELCDGIVDFDELVRNPGHRAAFKDGFDSGDHLHPSKMAYRAMGLLAYEKMKDVIG